LPGYMSAPCTTLWHVATDGIVRTAASMFPLVLVFVLPSLILHLRHNFIDFPGQQSCIVLLSPEHGRFSFFSMHHRTRMTSSVIKWIRTRLQLKKRVTFGTENEAIVETFVYDQAATCDKGRKFLAVVALKLE
ncbi:hypothetical protein T03_11595, partial [Trichinella britovi]